VDLTGRRVHIVLDNTSAKGAIRKGFSSSFGMNLAVKEVLNALRDREVREVKLSYVKSADNPADGPSRQKWVPLAEILTAWKHSQQLPSVWGLGFQSFRQSLGARPGRERRLILPT